ncbi:hypothetical protein MNBD_DELTA04-682 [hydrothermal vent metagenome]|uniref:TRASH domain-containing protein n=1 Tax=hydrothermal vent metagenome TaxID=652676 RepID=A0A3B0VRE7_9ZZZZ
MTTHKHIFRDPVCGMTTEDPGAFTAYDQDGETYYFCSDHCLAKFKENPHIADKATEGHHEHGHNHSHG